MTGKRIEIIMGRAGSGKTYRCLSDMSERIKHDPLANPLFIIVPEHETYRVERSLAEMMNENYGFGFVGAQVFGFRSLALQVIQSAGRKLPQTVSELGRRLVIKKILLDKEDSFSSFGKAIRQSSFVGELSSLITEFKSYGVIKAYRERKENLKDREQLRKKLEDMEIIQTAFDDSLKSGETVYSDLEELMNELLFLVPSCHMFRGAEIWIDGFTFFEPLELEIIKAFFKAGCKLHITLNIDKLNTEEGEISIFQRQRDTYRDISRLSDGMVYNTFLTGEKHRFTGASRKILSCIEEKMFSLGTSGLLSGDEEDNCNNIKIVEAANRRQEIELMAADIKRLCREEGYSYRDIAVLIRDWNDYGFMLPLVMADYDIPVYCDKKQSAVFHPLAELIISVLSIFTGNKEGWKYESIFRALKTGFFPADKDEIDLLENYVLEFGIKGKQWINDKPWSYYRNQKGEEAAAEESTESELLKKINDIRLRVSAPLKSLSACLYNENATVGDISKGIYKMMLEISVPDTLEQWSIAAEENGNPEAAKRHKLIWNHVVNLLEELTKTIGDERLEENEKSNIKTYYRIMVDGLSRISFSMIPPGLDYVTVSSFDGNSMDNVRAVYILGVNAGIMPKGIPEPVFITREERNELENLLGIKLPGRKPEEESLKELYTIYRGFTRMREYLWVSYSLSDGRGEALLPSTLVEKLEAIIPALKSEKLSVGDNGLISVSGMEERLFTWQLANKRQAVVKLAGVLRELKHDQENDNQHGKLLNGDMLVWPVVYNKLISENDKVADCSLLKTVIDGFTVSSPAVGISGYLARELYAGGKKLRGSVSSIQDYYGCPFQYYAKRGLRLRPRDEFSFAPVDKGNLLHNVMELFAEEIKKKNDLTKIDSEILARELTEKAANNVHNQILLRDEQMRGLLERIEMTARMAIKQLLRLSVSSAFQTTAIEKEFVCPSGGMEADRWKLTEDIIMEIRGKIDRIDTMEHQCSAGEHKGYVLIIDYKTGSTSLKLKDIYDGQNLQLITYLMAAMELNQETFMGISIIPAGLYYFYLKNLIISQDEFNTEKARTELEKELRLSGWTLDDEEIMDLISRNQACVDVKKVSRGSGRGSKNAQSEEFLGAVQEYVRKKLLVAGKEIIDGNNRAYPYRKDRQKTSCSYCDYKSVCGFDPQIDGFDYRQAAGINDEEIKQLILDSCGKNKEN